MDLLSWDHHSEDENLVPAPEASTSDRDQGTEETSEGRSAHQKRARHARARSVNGQRNGALGRSTSLANRFGALLDPQQPLLSEIAELYEASQVHKKDNQEAVYRLLGEIKELQRALLQPLDETGTGTPSADVEATVTAQINKLDKQVTQLAREYDRLHRIIEGKHGRLQNLHVLEHTNKQIYAAIVVDPLSPDAQRPSAAPAAGDQGDPLADPISMPTLPAILRKPTRSPSSPTSPYHYRARTASPSPPPLNRSTNWAAPRSAAAPDCAHTARAPPSDDSDLWRTSPGKRARSHTSLGFGRPRDARKADSRRPLRSARAVSVQSHVPHDEVSANGEGNSEGGSVGEGGSQEGSEARGDTGVSPEAEGLLRAAYMAGLLHDAGAFAAGRREVLAVGQTFEYMASRLQRERVTLPATVRQLQAALRHSQEEMLKMLATHKEAERGRELAAGALQLAHAQLERRRKDWARRLAEKEQVNQLNGDVRALLKRREQQRREIRAKAAGRREQEAKAKAKALARSLLPAGGFVAAAPLEPDAEKVTKRLTMMMAAARCTTLRELVHKVGTQTEARATLNADAEEGKAKAAVLRDEAARLQSQLRDLHFVEAGMLDNRKKIDSAGEALAAAERKAVHATQRCERAYQVLASSKTGIEHLALQLGVGKEHPNSKPSNARPSATSPHSPHSPHPHPPLGDYSVDADASVALLAACEDKEASLLAAIADAAARPPAVRPAPASPPRNPNPLLNRPPRSQSLAREASMDRTNGHVAAATETARRVSNRALMSRERALDRSPAAGEADSAAHPHDEHEQSTSTRRESERFRHDSDGGVAAEEEGGGGTAVHLRVMEFFKGTARKETRMKGGQTGARKDSSAAAAAAAAKSAHAQTVSRLWLGDARLAAQEDTGAAAGPDGAAGSSSDEEGHRGHGTHARVRHSEMDPGHPPRAPAKSKDRLAHLHGPPRRKTTGQLKGAVSEAAVVGEDFLLPVRTREDMKKESAARVRRTRAVAAEAAGETLVE